LQELFNPDRTGVAKFKMEWTTSQLQSSWHCL